MRQVIPVLLCFVSWSTLGLSTTGRVLEDNSGNPLSGAEVDISQDGNPQLLAELETNASGQFQIPELPTGAYRFAITKPNYLPVTLRTEWPAASPELLIRLARYGVISGRVLDGNNQAITHAYVSAVDTAGRSPNSFPVAVDGEGGYRLFGLPPGEYRVLLKYGASTNAVGMSGDTRAGPQGSGVTFYPPGSSARIFSVSGGEDYRDIDFTVAPEQLHRVAGTIDVNGPRAGFWIALISNANPAYATAVTIADENGNFSLEGIPTARYTVIAYGPSGGRTREGAMLPDHPLFGRIPIDIGSDTTALSIPVAPGRSISLLIHSKDESCLTGLALLLTPEDDWAGQAARTVHLTPDQAQTVSDLAPARYRITGADDTATCYPQAGFSIDLRAAAIDHPITIDVGGGGSLHITAPEQKKQPVLLVSDSPSATQRIGYTDANGHVQFNGLKPGRYRLALPSSDMNLSWLARVNTFQEVAVQPGQTSDITLNSSEKK